jgi:hypothetical protein
VWYSRYVKSSEVAAILGPIAQQQLGYIVRAQAQQLGVSDLELLRAVQHGYFEREERGLYRSFGAPQHPLPQLWAPYLTLHALGCEPQAVRSCAQAVLGLGSLESDPQFAVSKVPDRTPDFPGLALYPRTNDAGIEALGMLCQSPARIVYDLLVDGHDVGHVAEIVQRVIERRLASVPDLRATLSPLAQMLGLASSDDVLQWVLAQAGWEL